MTARRETIVAAIIEVARNDALSDDERESRVTSLMAGTRVCRATERPARIWMHHPRYTDLIVRESICGND